MTYQITEKCTGCTLCARKCPVGAISGERKIQHWVDPALCIGCGVCGKVCAFGAIVNAQGSLALRQKQDEWLQPVWNLKRCVACGICVEVCPTGSIDFWRNAPQGQRLAYPPDMPHLAHPQTCIGCAFCECDCPTACITMQKPQPRQPASET
ncbi:MAG: 4Fe-4S binding protein [Anaerolineaceae bacterium]|nr:4Fe-4S binding protein [Anaerolineaceae bacterium]